ncbi:MAG: hypothetical protein JNJ70_22900 [Verrucomicrobiales bacterium]|nr:hypothetical protein [Verrucomicrobiales bacterium]
MKPSFLLRFLSLLFMGGGALLLPACETLDERRSAAARPEKGSRQTRQGPPAPYYGMNAPGNQAPVSSGWNSNYQPPIRRYDPNRPEPAPPREEERPKRRPPFTLMGTEFSY